ncbi:hypothetical protein SH2C18_00950 [Clostridium sediminicola]|uniref:tocopherol cyclase family protein n=1 Tax=Clostridium sediminicola TaxID=3114879 RepID=UPI0031F210A6
MFKKINPDVFHSSFKGNEFFEGWYFKIVSKDRKIVLAIIPGISRAEKEEDSHSFIQLLSGVKTEYSYIKYDLKEFTYTKNKFDICVDKNLFSLKGINININNRNKIIKGKLTFNEIKKWPDSVLNPGSMGFYNHLNFMECYSQVCALDGKIEGNLAVDGEEYNFNGGNVYIEKNWGRAFPESWIWIQTNSFKQRNAAFTCSTGKVPFFAGSFKGFLVALLIDNKFYKFTTINRSKMKIELLGNDMKLSFKRKNLLLTVITKTEKEKFMLCYGPKDGKMIPLVKESLCGEVKIELINEKKQELIFRDTGYCSGIEYGGEYSHH